MNNKTALFLAVVIVGLFIADAAYFHWGLPVIAGKKLSQLTEWIAVWR